MAAHPNAVRATAFVALFVAACGSGQQTTGGALGDASQDAFPGADAGDASAEDGGGADAGADATPDHGVSPSECAEPPDGGALADPEVIASGRAGLSQIRTTDFGPVWMEFEPEPNVSMGPGVVFLGSISAPPRELFACKHTTNALLETSARHFEVFCGGTTTVDWGGDFSIGDIGTGAVATWSALDCDTHAGIIDESSIYEVGFDITGAAPRTVDVAPLDSPCTRTKLLDLGTDELLDTAIDDSRLYALVVKDEALRQWAIYSAPKSGGAKVMLTEGIADPGAWFHRVTVRAHNATLAWAYYNDDWPPRARFVKVLPRGSSTVRTLVDEPDGIAPDGIAHWGEVAIALDDEFLYWTTQTGFVKRVRLCGGTPEVIAENQQNPIAIAVDDRAVYWLDYGSTSPWQDLNFWRVDDGKVMRMRKLDAPGYAEAGTDAGISDASAGDGDAGD